MQEISVGIVGATGYGGAEIARLIAHHPKAKLVWATSSRRAGDPIARECPWLDTNIVLEAFEPSEHRADVIFLCQESGYASKVAPEIVPHSRVIDLSADYRLQDVSLYPVWYGNEMPASGVRAQAVYGLPELVSRGAIRKAPLVANPGCYPTSALLALVPLQQHGLLAGMPIIDAKSGVSGAGRSKATTDFLFAELFGNFKPYGVIGHRHTPEIEQMLGLHVRFTPHLLPIARGICSTIHVPIKPGATAEELRAVWHRQYSVEPFVSVLDSGWPSVKDVHGTNRCILACDIDVRTGWATLVSVIDNLGKGAAGQAVQNMNIMFDFCETDGLTTFGVYP